MTQLLALLAGGICVGLLVRSCAAQGMCGRKVRACVAALVERGATVEYGGWTCYRSTADPPYVILQHDELGNYVYRTEERMSCPHEAATKFVRHIAETRHETLSASDGKL